MRRAIFAVLAASGLSLLALSEGACSILAGYEDLRLTSGDTDIGDAGSLPPLQVGTAAIYSVFPTVFSPSGDLAGVTAQLKRIHDLGFNVISLMPVTPIGAATGPHVTYNSPYCVHDYYAINPAYGSPPDLVALVGAAHELGLYVILDEEINHTSWDNALITAHPEYYAHSDGNPTNVSSIEEAFSYADVAQLDYGTNPAALEAYITTMLEYWLKTYGVDGFRFLTVDMPEGDDRTIPQDFLVSLQSSLEGVHPNVVMWADEEDSALAGAPFELDYGWDLRGGVPGATGGAGLQQVANGAPASDLETAWEAQAGAAFAGVKHATILETWDFGNDITVYGGLANTMAAATFNFMIDGVPMLWNGEEVGNDASGSVGDSQTPIDWDGPNATLLTAFYTSLLALRNGHTALQTGTTAWVPTSAPSQVASFTRTDGSGTYLVAINFSASAVTGTLTPPTASGWTDVSPSGSPGTTAHALPPVLSLAPYDFAVFVAQ